MLLLDTLPKTLPFLIRYLKCSTSRSLSSAQVADIWPGIHRTWRTLCYITHQRPGGGGAEDTMATPLKMPWQHHSNCGPTCSLVVWYSPDLLQWCGRQMHTSVTSVIVTLFSNYFINQWIDHHQQQSVKRSKNTVSTGLCFLLSERQRNGLMYTYKKSDQKQTS